ncbi:acyltransferase family protein [Pseudoalteromonas nigrifaciens]|uniref:acyltransferase family protein n=1 Tax=Pseudoalteromonas nigrifaciens TaxID=28109 RepID=UPI001787A6DC|nr:acyltransferase family protein [Pseudoalteromonas nigrifaciens]
MINRDNSPDAIKGMCILLMVFGHVSYIGSFTSSLYTVKAFIYTFHMPLFLILSGYFFSFNANIQNSALKILKRIALPYLIFIFYI